MATQKPRLTIYLASQELLQELQAIADEQQRSVSNLASIALADWIAEYRAEKNHKQQSPKPARGKGDKEKS